MNNFGHFETYQQHPTRLSKRYKEVYSLSYSFCYIDCNFDCLFGPPVFCPANFVHAAEVIYMYTNKFLSIVDIFYKRNSLIRLLCNCSKRFMGWTLHMIMCVLLCYPVSFHLLQLLLTGHSISSFLMNF